MLKNSENASEKKFESRGNVVLVNIFKMSLNVQKEQKMFECRVELQLKLQKVAENVR